MKACHPLWHSFSLLKLDKPISYLLFTYLKFIYLLEKLSFPYHQALSKINSKFKLNYKLQQQRFMLTIDIYI